MAIMDPNTISADGTTPSEQLAQIATHAHELVSDQYKVLNEILIPKLAEQSIRFIRRKDWTEAQQKWLENYFNEELLPILTPVGLDSAHPFPRILNKSLNFIISLTGKDASVEIAAERFYKPRVHCPESSNCPPQKLKVDTMILFFYLRLSMLLSTIYFTA